MPILSLRLETVSPLFLYGAYQGHPELRAASIRGQLRYWLRAIVGASTTHLNEVWERESAVFGSTERGSVVSVRINEVDGFVPIRQPLLPHRRDANRVKCIDDPRRKSTGDTEAVPENTQFVLAFTARPGRTFDSLLLKALSTWLLLGGVGRRSRRMFGGFAVVAADGDFDIIPPIQWRHNPPQSPDEFVHVVQRHMTWLSGDFSPLPNPPQMPKFPILHPKHACIEIGYQGYYNAADANQSLFNELLRRGDYCKYEYMFGFSVRNDRRASPLVAQSRLLGDYLHPVITMMRSELDPPKHQPLRWDINEQFMRDFEQDEPFGGRRIWGTL